MSGELLERVRGSAYDYAFRMYGGLRPDTDKAHCARLADAYTEKLMADCADRSASQLWRVLIDHGG